MCYIVDVCVIIAQDPCLCSCVCYMRALYVLYSRCTCNISIKSLYMLCSRTICNYTNASLAMLL